MKIIHRIDLRYWSMWVPTKLEAKSSEGYRLPLIQYNLINLPSYLLALTESNRVRRKWRAIQWHYNWLFMTRSHIKYSHVVHSHCYRRMHSRQNGWIWILIEILWIIWLSVSWSKRKQSSDIVRDRYWINLSIMSENIVD